MKRIIAMFIVIFLGLLSFGISDNASGQGEFQFDFGDYIQVGDFMEMKMTGDDGEMEMTGYFRFEFTGEDTVTIKGKTYNCLKGAIEGNGDLDSDLGVKGTWKATGDLWIDKITGDTHKMVLTMDMKAYFEGETVTSEMEETIITLSKISTWTSEDEPEIGDNWEITAQSEVTVEMTMETPYGDETTSETDTLTATAVLEYLKDKSVTTKLGTFECKVVKTYDKDDSYFSDLDYDLDYVDKENGFPVKYETYEDGSVTTEMEVIAYKFGDMSAGTEVLGSIGAGDDDDDGGMLGLGKVAGIDTFILMIVAIIIVVVLVIVGVMMNKRKKAKMVQAAPQPQYRGGWAPQPQSGYQQPMYQQGAAVQAAPQPSYQQTPSYYQQPASPPPAPQPSYQQSTPTPPPPPPTPPPPSQYSCRTCGSGLKYIDQYQQWYCNYCQQYS